jgi:hypothetical protein
MQRINGRLATIEQQMEAEAFSGRIMEPTLADLISDPMTHAIMTADGVEYSDLEALLRSKRAPMVTSAR